MQTNLDDLVTDSVLRASMDFLGDRWTKRSLVDFDELVSSIKRHTQQAIDAIRETDWTSVIGTRDDLIDIVIDNECLVAGVAAAREALR